MSTYAAGGYYGDDIPPIQDGCAEGCPAPVGGDHLDDCNVDSMGSRLGKCYTLAGRRVLFDDDSRQAILVHGTIQRDPYPPNPHAWVIQPDGDVWEPISQIVLPAKVYAVLFNAVEVCRYSRSDVSDHTLDTGHWGPWGEWSR